MNHSRNGRHPEADLKRPDEQVSEQEIKEVGGFLRRLSAPPARPEARDRLMSALLAEADHVLPARRPTPAIPRLRWGWLVLGAQIRIVHRFTWIASLLVMALGFFVTLMLYRPGTGAELPFVIVAPLVAALGVAFLYGVDIDPALELQLATPVSPRLILLARLTLVFGFNLAVGLACSLALSLFPTGLSLWSIVLSWLAPMAFLSALAFLLSVLFFDPLFSALMSLLIWGVLVWRRFSDLNAYPFMEYVPNLLAPEFRLLLVVASVAGVVLALWLTDTGERRNHWGN
mgnify:CR=1 FL=1